jgi:hypothetical protein
MTNPAPSALRVLLGPPIAFHSCLVPVAGSITAALMLSQAIYWSPRTDDPGGWFYKTRDQWSKETHMSRWEQEAARKLLVNRGLMEEKRVGMPAKLHYRVDFERLEDACADLMAIPPPTGKRSTSRPVGHRAANIKAVPPPTLTENTSETTTETTAEEPSAQPAADAVGAELPPQTDQAHTDDPPPSGGDSGEAADGVPDRRQITDEIHLLYQFHNPGVKVPWTALAFLRLKREVERVRGWTTEQWVICVRNRYASDGIILGELPESFIPYLSRYISGPMDRYGKAKGANSGNVSARTARNRAALAEVVHDIRQGFGVEENA